MAEAPGTTAPARGQWGSRLGFVLAAAGSAVGLGNLWKFPYITGQNGGGLFVIVYLACIVLIGLPIMIAEVMIGKSTQKSPVGAFKAFGASDEKGTLWSGVGWLGVAAGFLILSYYSVVAGWSLHYTFLSATGTFAGVDADAAHGLGHHFESLVENPGLNLFWHAGFMATTIAIVVAGVQKGVERAARVLMPTLFAILFALVLYGATMSGFGRAFQFVFGLNAENFTAAGALEALGHAFFSLSLGMGAMLTYGSYMKKKDGVLASSIAITGLDTAVALMACLALFPITFTYSLEPSEGPGLVFVNMPIAFAQLPYGSAWATVFFLLLTFAALTSAISLLEVVASYFIDERGWTRPKAVIVTGVAILIFGVPSALSWSSDAFGSGMQAATEPLFGEGKSWFDIVDYLTSNWMLPLGALGMTLFVAFRVGNRAIEVLGPEAKPGGVTWFLLGWLWMLRTLVPIAIIVVMMHAIGVL